MQSSFFSFKKVKEKRKCIRRINKADGEIFPSALFIQNLRFNILLFKDKK